MDKDKNLDELNQEITSVINNLQQAIKSKNYNLISSFIHSLNQLMLNYLLALDYSIKNIEIDNEKFKEYKIQINAILLKLREYLDSKDDKLLSEIENYLVKLSNINLELALRKVELGTFWSDSEERIFLNILTLISELSNKVYQYYKTRKVMKEEIIQIFKKLQNYIDNLPDIK